MLVLSSNLQDNSILIQIHCQTSLLSFQGLDDAFSTFRVLLTDSGYHFNDPLNVYLTRQTLFNHEGKHSLNDITLDDLIESDPNERKNRNEPYRKLYPWQMMTGRILKHSNGDESCFTPTIELCNTTRTDMNENIPLTLNLLVVADRKTSMAEIRRLLEEQLTQQLDILESRLTNNNDSRSDNTFRHYYIKPVNQIVTCLDDEHEKVRNELQQRYPQLSFNHPLVAMDFGDGPITSLTSGGRLLNVHKGLPSRVRDGRQTFVDGHYAYYHYMQDNFDDNQWGCAYRSLQTLCSWFVLQGYTRKPVPTHSQIQQTLIDIGDKSKKFLNSRQWIGSMEVSYVLQNYLDVDCKISRVERGIDMADRVRELISHFNREGTPIMIGGGVLAHTIIGVDFNESTGESMLLVLDPHYTGVDDIRTIQDRGWVGWKPWSFWSSDAFYNLCCPLRPKLFPSK